VCLNRFRERRRVRPGDEKLIHIAGIEDLESRLDARAMLDRLFARHRDSTRTIAVLHFVDGFTLAEVAREVGMSVSGVRKRLRGLRESLEKLEDL
ncbi:MAG: sigma-70 family RNA polymerase sigma factor, partial [Gemmatimonadetes bacterium]|nr:sigma-70 family RNA polymerase sigma factor [Gemmatimonadota bacterium]